MSLKITIAIVLQQQHPEDFKSYLSGTSSTPLLEIETKQPSIHEVLPEQTDSYPRNHPKQKAFEKALQNWIVTDSMPFSVVSGNGFKHLVKRMDGRLNVPHRTTLARRLDGAAAEVFHLQKNKSNLGF